jgi:signal transduction histidine kinase
MAETTMAVKQPSRYREYWEKLGGERLYALGRWLILIPLLTLIDQVSGPVWPVTPDSVQVVRVFWIYAGFSLGMNILLLIPPLSIVPRYAVVGDLVFLALIMLVGIPEAPIFSTLFFAFFLVPLLNLATHQQPLVVMLVSLLTAILYGGVYLAGHGSLPDSYLLPGMQVIILLLAPWLTAAIVERWGLSNRFQAADAERRREQAQRDRQFYRERVRSFLHVTEQLARTLDYKQVLDTTLHEIRKLAPYHIGLVLFPASRMKEIKVETVVPANPSDLGLTFSVSEGTLASMLRPNASSILVDDISKDPEAEPITSLRSCKAACLVPLRMKVSAKLKTFGILLIASDQAGVFTEEHLEMITGIANYMIVTLYNAQLEFDLKKGQAQLIAKEKEVRDRIASKLHDGPTQKVAQIAMNTDFLKKAAENDQAMLLSELDKFGNLARIANSEMRMTLFELRPLILETEGLRAAMEEYVEKMKIRTGETKLTFQGKGSVDTALEPEAAGIVFDIIQESVNNALKHAEAKHILVRAVRHETTLEVIIQDDGKGFEPSKARQAASKRASFGLQNFGERAEMIGGTMEIDSSPGKGTKITMIVPISSPS